MPKPKRKSYNRAARLTSLAYLQARPDLWKPGFYVMVEQMPIRGPFKHEETARLCAENIKELVQRFPTSTARVEIVRLNRER